MLLAQAECRRPPGMRHSIFLCIQRRSESFCHRRRISPTSTLHEHVLLELFPSLLLAPLLFHDRWACIESLDILFHVAQTEGRKASEEIFLRQGHERAVRLGIH